MKNRHKLESILDKYINYLGDEYKKVEHGNKWCSNSCKLSKKFNYFFNHLTLYNELSKKSSISPSNILSGFELSKLVLLSFTIL